MVKLDDITSKVRELAKSERYIDQEVSTTNIHRLQRFAIILAVVHAAIIAIFWPYRAGATDITEVWRNGIIVLHFIMLVFSVLYGIASYYIEDKKAMETRIAYIIPKVVNFCYLLFSAVICLCDQLVTGGISPFIIASVGVAVALLVKPLYAVINYAFALLFIYYALPLVQQNQELLVSAQVNTLAAAGLGFGVSIVIWRTHILMIKQREEIKRQKEELEEKNIALELLAAEDSLTGLLNRGQFIRRATKEIADIERRGIAACIILFDIDDFKSINDNYGHPAGDHILQSIAGIMVNYLPKTDLIARFGGEEFIVMYLGTLQEGFMAAETVRLAIQEHCFEFASKRIAVTISAGVAPIVPQVSETFRDSYIRADQALYWAKSNGRNRVEMHCDGDTSDAKLKNVAGGF